MLKAGKYYVGDLCYILDGNGYDWIDVLEQNDYFSYSDYFEYKKVQGFCSPTMYGDGAYYDLDGHEFLVDAGIIGCWPMSALPAGASTKGGHVVDFLDDFTCDMDNHGVIYIGHLEIET